MSKLTIRVNIQEHIKGHIKSHIRTQMKSHILIPSSKDGPEQVKSRHNMTTFMELSVEQDYSITAGWSLPQNKYSELERHLDFAPSSLPSLSFHCTGNMAAVNSTKASQLLAITINCISLILSTVFLSVYQYCISLGLSSCGKLAAVYSTEALQLLLGNSVLYHSLPMIQSPHCTPLVNKPKHTEANRNIQTFLCCAFNVNVTID